MTPKLKTLEDKISNSSSPLLMTHVVLGYPSLEKSIELVKVMADSGSSIVELQIPFSDPIADGTSIMKASEEALKNGIRTKDIFSSIESLSKELDVPLLIMSYFNLVLNCESFVKKAKESGADALIVPDISPGESNDSFYDDCREFKIPVIPLVTPVTEDKRIEKIAKNFSKDINPAPFVYCVSTTGTTGARKELPDELPNYLKKIQKFFNMPRAVGFGISSKNQVRALKGKAEIAIIGSAIIDVIKKSQLEGLDLKKEVDTFIKEVLS